MHRPQIGRELAVRQAVGHQPLWWGVVLTLIAVCLAWLFRDDGLAMLWWAYQQPEYSHGYIIPLVSAYVIWQRWPAILRERSAGSWAGVALVAAALALLMLSKLALMTTPEVLALIMTLAGLALAALGWRSMRHLWVPLAFLLFALPVPGTAYVLLSLELQLISSKIGAWLLGLAGVPVFLDGNVIDLGVYQLQVAEACSGLRYLFPLTAFSFLCAWLYRGPFWARVVIVVSAVPITIFMNSVRIALTGLIIEHGSIALAEGFLHLFEGWVIFLAALVVLFALMWLLARLRGGSARMLDLLDFDRIAGRGSATPAETALRPSRPGTPAAACCGLLLAAVLSQGWLTDRSEVAVERPGLVTFPLRVGDWQGSANVPDTASLETLKSQGLDDWFLADFRAPGWGSGVNLWVAYYANSKSAAVLALHSPQACLPGAGWEFAQLRQVPAPVDGAGSDFNVNQALIQNGSERMLMYYWYEGRGRQFANEVWLKGYMLLDTIAQGRSDGALVRLMTPMLPHETIADADRRLADFFALMYPQLTPHVGA